MELRHVAEVEIYVNSPPMTAINSDTVLFTHVHKRFHRRHVRQSCDRFFSADLSQMSMRQIYIITRSHMFVILL